MTQPLQSTRAVGIALVLSICLAGSLAQAKKTVYVGTCHTGTHYSTIQAAVNAASANGPTTINVCPGSYPEQVIISKNKVTLAGYASGASDASVVLPPAGGLVQNGSDIFGNPVAAQIFIQNATGLSIKNMVIDATGNDLAPCVPVTMEGVYFQNSSGTLTDSVIRNQYQTDYADYGVCQNGLAVNVESLTSSSAVTVSNNAIRAYQKNGVTATGAATGPGSPGPVVQILSNYIVGLAATGMNWLTPGAAENGIQVGFGASGKILSNTVSDNIWGPDTIGDSGDAASGILIYASPGFTLMHNNINSAQFGILAVTDTADGYGTADNTIVESNNISGTQIFDGIDMCSSSNTVESNVVSGSAESAIHLDDTCGSGNNNTVKTNTITEACAGVLLGTGTGNSVSGNPTYGADFSTLAGDTCTPPQAAKSGSAKKPARFHPSPYKPMKR